MTSKKVRTSKTDPLQIAELDMSSGLGLSGGMVGITFCPGKQQKDGTFGVWKRDLSTDLIAIKQWGAEAVLCLLEQKEISDLGVESLPVLATELGMTFHHLPIIDGEAPSKTFEAAWRGVSKQLYDILDRGGRVLVHCKGGLGRAGTVAARMLIDYGDSVQDALAKVRRARSPNAIETKAQEHYLTKLAEQTRHDTRIDRGHELSDLYPWVSCAIKLFRMVNILHARGYQRLRICPTAGEMSWGCAIAPAKIFSAEHGALIGQETPSMTARFGSGDSCQPFGWRESIKHLLDEELADRFSEDFPVILRESSGSDWTYAGWYQEFLKMLGSDRVPIAHYWDYRENGETEIYRQLRLFSPGGEGSQMPLPPIFRPDADISCDSSRP
jgi:protein-tyrosine phosphatase